ncbi:MAG: sulfatase [Cyclobacteriaceae bacterium]
MKLKATTKPNIFLITLDSLRPDFVSSYGIRQNVTPFIDSLANSGVKFNAAYSSGLWSDPSVASMVSGQFPHKHRVLAGIDSNLEDETIAEVLTKQGYSSFFVGTGSQYLSEVRQITKGYKYLVDTFSIRYPREALKKSSDKIFDVGQLLYSAVVGRDVRLKYSIDKTQKLLRRKKDVPVFGHMHLFFFNGSNIPYFWNSKWRYIRNHKGFDVQDFNQLRRKIQKLDKETRLSHKFICDPSYLTERELGALKLLYEASANYADQRVKGFFEFLKSQGLFDNSIFIITADHGENLGEHGMLSHNFSASQQIINIPLVIWSPNSERHEVDYKYSHVNLKNIITELADSEKVDVHAIEEILSKNDDQVYFEDGKPGNIVQTLQKIDKGFSVDRFNYAVKGVVCGDWKLIKKSNGEHELYNIKLDPEERDNLALKELEKLNDLSNKVTYNLGGFDESSKILI